MGDSFSFCLFVLEHVTWGFADLIFLCHLLFIHTEHEEALSENRICFNTLTLYSPQQRFFTFIYFIFFSRGASVSTTATKLSTIPQTRTGEKISNISKNDEDSLLAPKNKSARACFLTRHFPAAFVSTLVTNPTK